MSYLTRDFFERDVLTVARDLIGVELVWHGCAGIIVETEAYSVEGDLAAHTATRPSAREFVKMIQTAGLLPQGEAREPFLVAAPMEFQMGETLMTVFPHDRWKITCVSSDKLGRFTQHFSLELTPESVRRELADARTFCFYEEIEHLIKNGLIKGGQPRERGRDPGRRHSNHRTAPLPQ